MVANAVWDNICLQQRKLGLKKKSASNVVSDQFQKLTLDDKTLFDFDAECSLFVAMIQ
eukprot:SAG31_NODE_19541_length_599_cov_0.906000_1_plen_58_part_00